MELISKSAFAARQGWRPSYVTQLLQTGRLVMQGDFVDVEQSLALIAATADPSRDGAVARHANTRAKKAVAEKTQAPEGCGLSDGGETRQEPQKAAPEAGGNDDVAASYSKSRAIKEHFAAQSARLAYEREAGKLCETADVMRAGTALGIVLRTALEGLPDQISPELAPMSEVAQVHALLVERFEGVLRHVSGELARLARDLTGGEL